MPLIRCLRFGGLLSCVSLALVCLWVPFLGFLPFGGFVLVWCLFGLFLCFPAFVFAGCLFSGAWVLGFLGFCVWWGSVCLSFVWLFVWVCLGLFSVCLRFGLFFGLVFVSLTGGTILCLFLFLASFSPRFPPCFVSFVPALFRSLVGFRSLPVSLPLVLGSLGSLSL